MGLGGKGFRIRERKLENGVTGFWGRCVGAASDRAGRVEGWDCLKGGDVTEGMSLGPLPVGFAEPSAFMKTRVSDRPRA
jgi:hypothetical protein